MKGEREVDKFLGDTPYLTSNNHHHYRQQNLKGGSSWSYTSGFGFGDGGSSSFDQSEFPTPITPFSEDQFSVGSSFSDSWYRRPNNGVVLDEHSLAREFQKMNIGNRPQVSSDIGGFGRGSDAFRSSDCNVAKIRPSSSQNFGFFQGYTNGLTGNGNGNGAFPSSVFRDERIIKDDVKFRLGQRGFNLGDTGDSITAHNHSDGRYGGHGYQNGLMNFPFEETTHHGDEYYGYGLPIPRGNKPYGDGIAVSKINDCHGDGVPIQRVNSHTVNGGPIQRGDGGYSNYIHHPMQSMYEPHVAVNSVQQCVMEGCKEVLNSLASSQNFSTCQPYSNEALVQQARGEVFGNMSGLNSVNSSPLIHSKHTLNRGNLLYNSMRQNMRASEGREGTRSVAPMRKVRQIQRHGRESTLIIQEKGLNCGMGKSDQTSGNTMQTVGEMSFDLNGQSQPERTCGNGSRLITCDPIVLQTIYNSLAEVQGNIYLMAKDQHGCRFLQKKFDEGSFEDVLLIFNEIIDHVAELMMNPFGNYLIQKLLDVCDEEQRMRIVHVVTRERGELVRISLNTHGTRVVQKLVESLTTRNQISLVIRALEPGFLDLIKDLNGNHVVQRCLQSLSSDDNKFIFDAAAKFCVEIATHQHGCCVLQRCIDHSSGEHRQKLVEEICRNGLHIAQDPFGNYVVQYIIGLKMASASAELMSQFEGHYAHLSMQKFSSHVVEKCLRFVEDSQPRIVYELLSVPSFDQLMQDPYANYVIQAALDVTKGSVHDSLAAAVRPNIFLRTNPHCKKIFSRLKK